MAQFTDDIAEQINRNRVAIGKLETTATAHGKKLDDILLEVRKNGEGGIRSLDTKRAVSVITGVLIVVGGSIASIVDFLNRS